MTDLVYTLGTGSNWGDREIVYSLRSFAEHFPDLGQVWIVGEMPAGLRGVKHIDHPDPYRNNKDANKINKVLRACAEASLSEQFVWCSDDQCLVADAAPSDFKPYFVEELSEVADWGDSLWVRRLRNTYERLALSRHTTYNLEAHTPLLISKELFPKVMLRYDYGAGVGYNLATLYFNALGTGGRPGGADEVRIPVLSEGASVNLGSRAAGHLFLSYNDNGLDDRLAGFLEETFPRPSRYETVCEN